MNNTNKRLIESLINSTEKCKLIAEVYHLPGGTNDDHSSKSKLFLVLIVNKSVDEMGILFINNVQQQQQASVQSSQRNRSTSSATKDNNSNTSSSTTTKSRGAFFTSSASVSEDSLLSEPTTNDLSNINHSLKLTHFFPLKSSDFSLTVLGQLQFELVFKQQNISLIMEAASIGTMWSAMSALTNAIKELNQLATSTVDGNSTDVDAHSWYQYYVNQCSSVTRSSSIGSTASSTNVDESNSLASSSSAVSSSLSSITDSLIERSSDYNLNSRDESEKVIVIANSLKDDWIKTQLKARENEFTEEHQLRVVVGTWNVNSKVPKQSLAAWLRLNKYEADIYVIGLQEIDMTAGALLREETEQGIAWSNRFDETFSQAESNYYQVAARQLVGIYHVVYVHERHRNHISDVRTATEGVGVLGMMGNKGGVAIRFNLYETSFCFINSHLAPHMDAVARRNQNYNDIVRRTNFNAGAKYSPEKHDFFFWLGDLNYRIYLSDAEVRDLIKKGEYARILEHDQLQIEHKAGRVLNGMLEGKIGFQPTYKFDAGTQVYDTSEKKRVPSYTDRIFWRDTPHVKQEYYESNMEYLSSDHKPVVAGFTVGVRVIQQEKYQMCYRNLIKMLDRLENDLLPEMKLSSQKFTFDDVRYEVPIVQVLELENTGQVLCKFQFIPKPMEENKCKGWLQIEPAEGMFMPGEKIEVRLTVLVDSNTVSDLNSGKDSIDDILIIHLENGRDHFVSLAGNYLKSCFGESLESLVALGHPVRESPNVKDNAIMQAPVSKVPLEIWRLVDYIHQKGMQVEGIFKESGSPAEKLLIRDRLDTGEPFDAELETSSTAALSFAEVLLSLLESLSEPVIPYRFYKVCIEASVKEHACHHIVSKIQSVHANTFQYIMSFLRELLKYKDTHLVGVDELSIIFSRVILRPPKTNMYPRQPPSIHDQKAKVTFIKHFLISDGSQFNDKDLVLEATSTKSQQSPNSDDV